MEDPEIKAMGALADALSELDEDAQGRVLRWAADRYDVTLTSRGGGESEPGESDRAEDELNDQDISDEAPTFDEFADLYDAAGPKTDADRVLVAGYWLQAIQGAQSFQGFAVNKALKNLGHPVGNVTTALSNNKQAKPARVLQLRKSGSTRQARKTYKLTHEGLVHVRVMIAAS